jgi:hypothetical protein
MPEPARRWLRRDIAVALVTLVLLLWWEASGADLPLTRLFGTADGFAWRNHWLLERVLHDGAAWCLQAVFVVLGLNVLVPLPVIGAMSRSLRLRWWLMTLLCAPRDLRAARSVDARLKTVAGGGVRAGPGARPDAADARCPLRQPQPVDGLDLLEPERAAVASG